MDENNKQSIIGIEKNFIWAKLRATAQKTASQITLRDCSRETWFIARFYVWSEQRTSKSGLQSFRILFFKKNQISPYTLNQYNLGMWNVVLSSKGTSIGVPGSERQFSHSVVSDYLLPHGLQHTMLPCPSPTLGACSNSCPSSQWSGFCCHSDAKGPSMHCSGSGNNPQGPSWKAALG